MIQLSLTRRDFLVYSNNVGPLLVKDSVSFIRVNGDKAIFHFEDPLNTPISVDVDKVVSVNGISIKDKSVSDKLGVINTCIISPPAENRAISRHSFKSSNTTSIVFDATVKVCLLLKVNRPNKQDDVITLSSKPTEAIPYGYEFYGGHSYFYYLLVPKGDTLQLGVELSELLEESLIYWQCESP